MFVVGAAAVVLVTVAAYSGGASLKGGSTNRPAMIDLLAVMFLAAGSVVLYAGTGRLVAFTCGVVAGAFSGWLLNRRVSDAGFGHLAFGADATRWRRFLSGFGNYQSRLLLAAMYFVVFGPSTLPGRRASATRMRISGCNGRTMWSEPRKPDTQLQDARRQF